MGSSAICFKAPSSTLFKMSRRASIFSLCSEDEKEGREKEEREERERERSLSSEDKFSVKEGAKIARFQVLLWDFWARCEEIKRLQGETDSSEGTGKLDGREGRKRRKEGKKEERKEEKKRKKRRRF